MLPPFNGSALTVTVFDAPVPTAVINELEQPSTLKYTVTLDEDELTMLPQVTVQLLALQTPAREYVHVSPCVTGVCPVTKHDTGGGGPCAVTLKNNNRTNKILSAAVLANRHAGVFVLVNISVSWFMLAA